jgi:hypothetical protein
MPRKLIDITGQKFNKLTAIKFSHKVGKISYWIFECECGNKKSIVKSKVVNGYTKACGCQLIESHITHGLAHRPKKNQPKNYPKIYTTWMSMKNRCHNKNEPSYKYYGAKGIFVCDEWHEFENFYNDMGEPPTKDHSIDRIDNSKGYSKDNCRWATRKQQHYNKTNNVYFEYEGQLYTLVQLSEKYLINKGTFMSRILRGLDIKAALLTPIRK